LAPPQRDSLAWQTGMTPPTGILDELANLHDAFMNADLMRMLMQREDVAETPQEFFISDRGRLERAWAAYLYILIEAWRAKSNASVRQYIESKISLDTLEQTLAEADESGLIQKLREVRHCMCHRDRWQYWDKGRYEHLGNLTDMLKLNHEFGKIFLSVMSRSLSEVRHHSSAGPRSI
jgi:hypothetical protein